MRIQPIECATAFGALLKDNAEYTDRQLKNITIAEQWLNLQHTHGSSTSHLDNIKNKGYDAYIKQAQNPEMIAIFLGENRNTSNRNPIFVGNYGNDFDINDVYRKINQNDKIHKRNKFGKHIVIGGIITAAIAALTCTIMNKHKNIQEQKISDKEIIDVRG